MNSKQLNVLLKNPAAMLRYQTTGKLPVERKSPITPLQDLLEQISPSDRSQLPPIRVSPKLGYNNEIIFAHAEQLLRWVQSKAGYSWHDARFRKVLKFSDLAQACTKPPPENLLSRYQGSVGCFKMPC